MIALQTHRYTDDTARLEAVLNRDARANGAFYYAVRSTGIYCRPGCPARRPKPENVVFFLSPTDAEEAGYRSCHRCHPNEVSPQDSIVARIQELLETSQPAPSLADLAGAVGLSPSHLQRTFKRATGLSPKQYADTHRTARLKSRLTADITVTEAMYDAGYGSSRALYEHAAMDLGMSPSSYKKGGRGQRVAFAIVDSPLGRMLIAATQRGLCAVRFGEDDVLTQGLRDELPEAEIEYDAQAVAPYTAAVFEHLAGRCARLDLPIDVPSSAFQRRVWAAIRQIPYGETRTYSEIAQVIGEPNAIRAVARACAVNPVALAVPCHRVVRIGGALAGYRWGIERKAALLDLERSRAPH